MTNFGVAIDPASEPRRIARQQRRSRLRPWGEGVVGVVALSLLATGLWFQGANQSTPIDPAALFAQEFGSEAPNDAPTSPTVTDSASISTSTAVDDDASAPTAASEDLASDPAAPEATASTDAGAVDNVGSPATQASPAPAGQGTASQAPSTPPVADLAMPAEGIYTYATTGYESLSLGGARHDYPDESYVVTRHTGGCQYTLDHRILEEKEGMNTMCHQGPEMQRQRYDGAVTFFGQSEESHYACEGVIMDLRDTVGAVHRAKCVSEDGDGETHETITLIAKETMTIGGVEVEAWHYHQDSEIVGAVHGGGEAEFWFRPTDGLMLRTERTNQSFANAFGGDVEYNEDATFQLTSLTPQR